MVPETQTHAFHTIALRVLVSVLLAAGSACDAGPRQYLLIWAGDAAHTASDFLGVIGVNPTVEEFARIVTSIPTGVAGTHPHHTEHELPASGHLLANGFHAGRTWLFDVSHPTYPKVLASFGDVAGYNHPHTFVRLPTGEVLATFQYRGDHATGGLVHMDERGQAIRSGSARDASIQDPRLYPYSVLPLPALDRAVSTTTDMDDTNTAATSEWVQIWRLSDLTLLRSMALKPGPRGDEHRLTGEVRLLPDGGIYIHTFNCGLYLLRGIDRPEPTVRFVRSFEGKECGVPILTSHYWLQTVPDTHALVALDIADPEHPRETSTVTFGDDERPHWIAIDSRNDRRVVVNSGGNAKGNRLFLVNFDPAGGALSIDERFRDAGSDRSGVDLTAKTWPHGFTGTAVPHGTVFSR